MVDIDGAAAPGKRQPATHNMLAEGEGVLCQLITQDGDTVVIGRDVARMCTVLADMIEEQDDDNDDPIPCPNIDTQTMLELVRYLKHHFGKPIQEIDLPLQGQLFELIEDDFDVEFIKKNDTIEQLCALLMAANYLNVKSVFDLVTSRLGELTVKDKSPEEVREMYGLSNDFSDEELDRLVDENVWCDELLDQQEATQDV